MSDILSIIQYSHPIKNFFFFLYYSKKTAEALSIKYGIIDMKDPEGSVIPVQEIVRHDRFRIGGSSCDIAILKLKKDIVYSKKAQPIALPASENSKTATSGFFAGWGLHAVRYLFHINEKYDFTLPLRLT